MAIRTPADEEREADIGRGIRRERLRQDLDQITLAKRANISLSALKNLESGKGSTLLTLTRVLRALQREDILTPLTDPVISAPRHGRYGTDGTDRQRASGRRR